MKMQIIENKNNIAIDARREQFLLNPHHIVFIYLKKHKNI